MPSHTLGNGKGTAHKQPPASPTCTACACHVTQGQLGIQLRDLALHLLNLAATLALGRLGLCLHTRQGKSSRCNPSNSASSCVCKARHKCSYIDSINQ